MNLQENKEGLELLKTAIEKAGYTGKVSFGFLYAFLFLLVKFLSKFDAELIFHTGCYWNGCCCI